MIYTQTKHTHRDKLKQYTWFKQNYSQIYLNLGMQSCSGCGRPILSQQVIYFVPFYEEKYI
jgi:hypothetical protein